MIAISLGEIAHIVGGRLVDADPDTVVRGPVEYDSRRAAPGGLFLALPGERVDGHDYVGAAVSAGCVAAIVSRPVQGLPRIEVGDGIAALSALAAAVARRLPATTVGITGSSGKTSTKDLIAHLLAAAGPTVAAIGSANNELGFPYTVLRADADTRFLVLELGARGVGHVRWLTELAAPRIGAVLNVGSAHLGEFGSRAAIAAAKGELVEALPAAAAGGIAVLNADDPLVRAMAERTGARVVLFSATGDDTADVRADDVRLDDGGRASFTLRTVAGTTPVRLQVVGVHQVANALAAAAVAAAVGMSVDLIADGLESAHAVSPWRMALSERSDGVAVLNDAYNANPESMRVALDALTALAAKRPNGRSLAVLGEMAELGAATDAEHVALGAAAATRGVDEVLAVGTVARFISDGAARSAGWRGRAHWFPDTGAVLAHLRTDLRPGDVVLVKASRAASLERLALAVAEDEPGAKVERATGGNTA